MPNTREDEEKERVSADREAARRKGRPEGGARRHTQNGVRERDGRSKARSRPSPLLLVLAHVARRRGVTRPGLLCRVLCCRVLDMRGAARQGWGVPTPRSACSRVQHGQASARPPSVSRQPFILAVLLFFCENFYIPSFFLLGCCGRLAHSARAACPHYPRPRTPRWVRQDVHVVWCVLRIHTEQFSRKMA